MAYGLRDDNAPILDMTYWAPDSAFPISLTAARMVGPEGAALRDLTDVQLLASALITRLQLHQRTDRDAREMAVAITAVQTAALFVNPKR